MLLPTGTHSISARGTVLFGVKIRSSWCRSRRSWIARVVEFGAESARIVCAYDDKLDVILAVMEGREVLNRSDAVRKLAKVE